MDFEQRKQKLNEELQQVRQNIGKLAQREQQIIGGLNLISELEKEVKN